MVQLEIAEHTYDTEFLCLCLVQCAREIILRNGEGVPYEIDTELFGIVNLPSPFGKVLKLTPAVAIKGHSAFCGTKAQQFLFQILEQLVKCLLLHKQYLLIDS